MMDEPYDMWDESKGGLFNDDGSRIDPEFIPKPSLCVTCKKDEAGGEARILCLLNRNDQRNENDFKCGAYEPKIKNCLK